MKTTCVKCGAVLQVRRVDLDCAGLTVMTGEEWSEGKAWPEQHRHMGCPFCTATRGGYYPLVLDKKKPAK